MPVVTVPPARDGNPQRPRTNRNGLVSTDEIAEPADPPDTGALMLRDATPADIAFIQAIADAPDNWDKLETYPEETLRQAILGPGSRVLIWQSRDGPQGFCWLKQEHTGFKLEEFGVLRPGRGTGRPFLQAVLDQLRQAGAARIWLTVAADNAGAIRFYSTFGFIRGAVRPGVWHRRRGPVADALRMDLALRP
ncbi:GNAT family N-acetyltransferase [Plastorhodobacter daqingensis]|uniref:GNAT family N-acetyltransferase n=1 Tax=Plastorhodobacter daqingensis TaxID=1387281 RepID=A0ABW2UK19_9RHOB